MAVLTSRAVPSTRTRLAAAASRVLSVLRVAPPPRPIAEPLDRKYTDELNFWTWFAREGALREHGRPFAEIYGSWQQQRLAELADWLRLDPPQMREWCADRTAIEIGGGPFPSISLSCWKRAIAVDPLAEGYTTQHLLPDACDGVVYIAAPGERVPLPAGVADLIVIENCLDHVEQPRLVLRECRRLLRPGGLLWLLVDLMAFRDHVHPNPFSEIGLRRLLDEEAFTPIRDRISAHKSHPEAYGEYRGLLRVGP